MKARHLWGAFALALALAGGMAAPWRGAGAEGALGAPAALPGFGALVAMRDPEAVTAAVRALDAAARGGDLEASVVLGRAYLQGLPALPRDPARAAPLLTRAAAAGHGAAALHLGVMHQNGEGVARDPAAAARWLEVAAKAGSPRAMFLLANAHRHGVGVPRDEGRALRLYADAAELEDPAALQALALAYRHGELGLDADEEEARRFAMEAAHASKHGATML